MWSPISSAFRAALSLGLSMVLVSVSASQAFACEEDLQCGVTLVCEAGRCQPRACSQDAECGVEGRCLDHACVAGTLSASTEPQAAPKYKTTRGIPLVWGMGLGLFGVTWLLGAVWGLAETDDARGYIPFVGPYLVADLDFRDGFEAEQGLAISIVQSLSFVMTLVGILVKSKVRLPGSANLMVIPTAEGGHAVLGGRF